MDRYTRLDRIHLHAADMYINVLAQLGIDDYRSDGLQFFTCKAGMTSDGILPYPGRPQQRCPHRLQYRQRVPQKRWPAKRFAAVADYFARRGFKCVFFGGPMDEAMVKEATSQMESDPIIATGKFTIGELASAIRCCSLFITNDSGPMHVAVSQGVPLVALYGPSNPKLYGPYTDRAIVLESTNHYEVGKSMKQIIREGNYKGISVIPMSQVIAAGEELLSRYYGRK